MSIATIYEDFFLHALPAKRRTYREFSEQELILPPGGPKAGLPWRCEYFPPSAEVFAEFDRGRYGEFYGSGPTQTGKTLIFCVLPTLYHLFEHEEDVILGAPVVEMAQAAYIQRILPAIVASRYRRLMPRIGGGSRGGKALFIQFGNGATLRFMGAGGGDQQRSSYTARVIVCTELDKMDEAGGSSREADPVSQIKARSSAYGSSARFYGECTMSVKGGRIYREVVERGTDSRVFLPCPHCRTWILPTRDGLVGWQDAPDVIEARARVRFKCSACGGLWTEEDRQKALKDPRVVTKGQEVGADGAVTGARPATMTFGFRWNSMSSPLRTMADIAREEWNAQQSGNREEEKALVQFTWAEPWEEEIADLNRPEIETVFGKIVGHERGTVPPDAVKTTLGIDVGSYVIWWSLYAWKSDAQGHLVDFGGIDVPLTGGKKNPAAVLAALRAYRDNVILPGWGGRRPDRIVIDSGYEQAVVYEFVKESGQPRYLAAKGYGSSSRHGGWRDPSASEPSETRHVGNQWLVSLQPGGIRLLNFHSDYWKAHIHDGFGAAQGAPGSITIFRGEKTDAQLRTFARMIVAEQREIKSTGDKEPKVVWVVKSRTNHYLDTSAMARLAADLEGVRLVKSSAKLPVPAGIRPPKRDVRGWVRTRY